MPNADARIETVGALFAASGFRVPAYQREFVWSRDEVALLFQDFFRAFQDADSEDPNDSGYFLGAIVTQDVGDGADWIVDGQQRVTSLCLLICALIQKASDSERDALKSLILRDDGQRFVLAVEGYAEEFRRYLAGHVPPRRGRPRNTTAALGRLADTFIELSEAVKRDLPDVEQVDDFARWLRASVFVVRIRDSDPTDAQRLYDRMNTRGRPLSDADRFRGKVLAELPHGAVLPASGDVLARDWKAARRRCVATLSAADPDRAGVDQADAERELILAWLVGRFASAEDPSRLDAEVAEIQRDPYDWATTRRLIGRERVFARELGKEFFTFIDRMAEVYGAANAFRPDLSGFHSATLAKIPFATALAAAVPPSRPTAVRAKTQRVVARFLDVLAGRRLWSPAWRTPTELRGIVLGAILDVRVKNVADLGLALSGRLGEGPGFRADNAPTLKGASNRAAIRHLLGRLGLRMAELAGDTRDLDWFCGAGGNDPATIEHVMGADYHVYRTRFPDGPSEFAQWRNRLGALALLPNRANAALRDTRYEDKLVHYESANPLVASLCASTYDGQWRFKGKSAFRDHGFAPMDAPERDAIMRRAEALASLASDVFDPDGVVAVARA